MKMEESVYERGLYKSLHLYIYYICLQPSNANHVSLSDALWHVQQELLAKRWHEPQTVRRWAVDVVKGPNEKRQTDRPSIVVESFLFETHFVKDCMHIWHWWRYTFWVQKIAVGGSNTTTSARMRYHLTKSGWEFVKIFFSEVKYGRWYGVLIFLRGGTGM